MRGGFPFVLLFAIAIGCSKDGLSANDRLVKARILYPSCAGTVVQFIDSTHTVGTNWRWFTNLKQPFDASNPIKFYPNSVSAFNIPTNKQVIGDTLEFVYEELNGPSGLVCALGGLPASYISVKKLKNN